MVKNNMKVQLALVSYDKQYVNVYGTIQKLYGTIQYYKVSKETGKSNESISV